MDCDIETSVCVKFTFVILISATLNSNLCHFRSFIVTAVCVLVFARATTSAIIAVCKKVGATCLFEKTKYLCHNGPVVPKQGGMAGPAEVRPISERLTRSSTSTNLTTTHLLER